MVIGTVNPGHGEAVPNIYQVLKETASAHPGNKAVIDMHETYTYEDLLALIDDVEAMLPENSRRVGIIMSHGVLMIASIFAVLKAGAAYVPVEPDFPVGRIKEMMEEAQVDCVLTERRYAGRVSGVKEIYIEDVDALERKHHAFASPKTDEVLDAYILYTSGTTGKPKGILVTHANVCNYARAFANEFHPGPKDVMLQNSVCTFDIFVEEVFGSLLNGAALAIPHDEDKSTIEKLMAFAAENGVTIISGFPYLLADMNALEEIPKSIRLLISGGDVLRHSYVDRLINMTEVYNTYGPSETTVCATYFHCNGKSPLSDGTYPIGNPVLGVDVCIADSEGNEMPVNETGEICISGKGVSKGYIGDHERENEAFVRMPDGTVVYHSGDLGYRDATGDFVFCHRKDRQIMIYGKRVEIAEVESRLYQCNGVQQAVVTTYNDKNDLPFMVAYVVYDDTTNIGRIKVELAKHLPSYMIPEYFIRLQAIPLNDHGKPETDKLIGACKAGFIQWMLKYDRQIFQKLTCC